ncbi:MAG: hypothetical protein QOF76_2309 [Solirubrobacteraceae bacterium]|jgi:diguanylate cyclase (GGDEF)-like protein|nr:hypothetical protein [Solirubrobacteraceae bacterium]
MTCISIPTASNDDARADRPVERLLEEHWPERARRLTRRELWTEIIAGAVFLACALALATGAGVIDGSTALLLGGMYAVVSRVEFPLGAGYFVPSYLVLVPMLFLLPPEIVPLLVAASLTAGALGQFLVRKGPIERVLFSVPDATHALGPALVLSLTGTHKTGLAALACYGGAFLAGCLFDMLSSVLREAGGLGVAPQLQLRVVVVCWLVDGCLAPFGLIIALGARTDLTTVLAAGPFSALLWLLARERSARIEQSRKRFDQAVTDPLTQLGNRRKLAADLETSLATRKPHVLMLFDLNGFKHFNDSFGHVAGDELLRRLSARLAEALVGHGTAYRLGGDEFCVLMGSPADLDIAIGLAADALQERGETFTVGATYGAALLPHEADTLAGALQLADERMYARKHRGSAAGEQAAAVLMQMLRAGRPSLHQHALEVASLAGMVGRELHLGGDELTELRRAAELHDIAEVVSPPNGVGRSAVLSERVLSAAPALVGAAAIVRAIDEHWDGTGHPDGLAGEAIPLAARIITVCDAYATMTTVRAVTPMRACAELRVGAGRQFDPAVVTALSTVCEREDEGDGLLADVRLRTARETAAQLRTVLEHA